MVSDASVAVHPFKFNVGNVDFLHHREIINACKYIEWEKWKTCKP